uniref:Uncharacterized protein n=1 Tax=viral metagenome TaxID=1070528 RepID=A0A6M3LHS9_9ZZZZ
MISEMIRDVLGSKEKLDWLEREINTKFKKGRGSQTPTVVTAGLLIEILDVLCEIRDNLSPTGKRIVKAEKLTDIIEETEEFTEEEIDGEELVKDEDSTTETKDNTREEEKVEDKKHQLSASTLRRIKQQKKKKK